MTATANDTLAIGKRLVELCSEGKHREAIEELYADDCKSTEVMANGPDMPRTIEGKAAHFAANDRFEQMCEIHGGSSDGPYPHDDEFIVFMSIDVTHKEGPMKGQRMEMKEACRYAVKDGKISDVKFFYDVSGYEG